MYKGNTSDPDINTTGKIPTNGVLFLSTQWGGDDDDEVKDDEEDYDDDEYDY